jgi:RNA polymerase sigma factor (sigma-70 family)
MRETGLAKTAGRRKAERAHQIHRSSDLDAVALMALPPSLVSSPDDRERRFDAEITSLYDQFADQAYRCARRGLSHEDAEEIVNFSFLAARMHWERVRAFTAPIGYVMKTVCNLRADALARRALRPSISLEDLPEIPGDDADVPANRDAHDRLHAALTKLSPREEQMVVLYYWTGLPAKDIAAVLEVQPGHVSRTLSDARARLRRLLTLPDGDWNEASDE